MGGADASPSDANPLFSAARWQQMRGLLDSLGEAAAEVRDAELARLAVADPELAASLRALLADAPAQATGTTSATVQRSGSGTWGAEGMPERIGPFRLIERIGVGGMGMVYLAEREGADFIQRVALKLLDGGSARLAQLASRERRILAALAHPHITAFVDAGIQDGRAWMAMEYVQGKTLLEHCREAALDVRERVALFDQMCAAVAHAHAHLVVHRDLKPSNVLVGTDGRAKLLDFGIALILDDEESSAPATRVFTPEYAAPEQLRGERATTASDVYSLGLILYELVSGKRLSTLDRTGRDGEWSTNELARLAITRDATSPPAATAASDPKALSRLLRGDLGRVVARALSLQPAQRYASVASLREDLARWRDFRPLTIARPTPLYVLRRFARRHRAGVALAVVAFAAILGLTAAALWQARAKSHEATVARAALRQSEATRDFINSVFLSADPYRSKGTQTTAGELMAAARMRIDQDLAQEPEVAAALSLQIGHVYSSLLDREATQEMMRQALLYNARSTTPSTIVEGIAKARLAYESNAPGRSEAALRALAEAIALLRAAGPDASAELASALRMQGNVQFSNDPDAAVASAAESLRLLEALDPPRTSDFMFASQVLADMLASLQRNEEALAAADRGLAHRGQADEDHGTMRAELQGSRARALTGLKRYAEAEPAIVEAIAGSRAAYGPEHGNTRYWRYRRAELLDWMGRLDEAAREMQALTTVPASSDEHPMARMAHRVTAAELSEQRRAATAAADIAQAQALACGSDGHPLFCAKTRLLAAEAAIREHRTDDAQAALETCAKDESVQATPRLARHLILLRARQARASGQRDAAHSLLETAGRDAASTPDEIALVDVERGYLALDVGDRAASVAMLTRAREHFMQSLTMVTPRVQEIDAALARARPQQ
jgi:tetratricopeptide (TPR) repeat protein